MSIVSNLSSFAKKAAPWISTIAGIAVPGAAPFLGIASKLLSTGLNKTVTADASSISNAITEAMADPDQLAKLKEIDDNFATQMRALGIQEAIEFEKIAADDRNSARVREEQVKDQMPKILGGGVVAGFLMAVFMILTGHAKAESVVAGTLVGYLSAKAELVLAYYFGSSASSDRKTELLAQAPPVPK